MKKSISLLLCLLMLFSLAACSGDEPAPAPEATPELTPEPPVHQPDPLEIAFESYGIFMTELGTGDNMQYTVESSIVRSVGDRSYEEEAKETIIYQGRHDGNPIILRDQKLSYYGQDTYVEYLYADGSVYVDGLYKAEMSCEDFMSSHYPLMPVDPELYEELSLDGSTITLASPSAPESWLDEDIELIDASAEIAMNGTAVESISYEAQYMQNHVTTSLSLKVIPGEYNDERDLAAEVPGSTGLKSIPDMYLPELFNRASIALKNSDSQSLSSTNVIEIDVLGFEYSSAIETYIFGSGADMTMQQAELVSYRQGWTSDGWYGSSSYRDGVFRYVQDGEVYEQTVPASALNMDSVMFSDLPAFRNLRDFELSYLDGYILIEFQVDPALGHKTQENICSDLFDWPERLDDMSTDFSTASYSGFLAFDADTMLPTSCGIDFEGHHTVYGNKRSITQNIVASFDLLSSTAQEMAAGIAAEEPEPETPASPLFYKVTGENGQTMWLFGTIHVGDERTAYLPESIYKALDQSQALALEVDPNAVQDYLNRHSDVARKLQDYIYYINGTTLGDNIDPQLYADAVKLMKAVGSYGYRADESTPTVWAEAIENAYMVHVGQLSSLYGVESRLIEIANNKNIEIRSIEDIGKQLTLFFKFSEELQELILADIVYYGRSAYAKDMMELYELWCQGDEDALREAICAPSEIEFSEEELSEMSEEEIAQIEACLAEYDKALGPDRNEQMIEKAVEYLESGETVFYAVGLAHLLDETGLLEGLRAAGYTVEPVG